MGRIGLSLVLVLVLAGCSSDPDEPLLPTPPGETGATENQTPGDVGEATRPIEDPILFRGPSFKASIEVMESMPLRYAASVEVTVNTGGWRLILDSAVHESDVVILSYTLEAPASDELVTQALETLRDRFTAGQAEIAGVRVHVSRRTRGEEPVEEPAYLLAATAPSG